MPGTAPSGFLRRNATAHDQLGVVSTHTAGFAALFFRQLFAPIFSVLAQAGYGDKRPS